MIDPPKNDEIDGLMQEKDAHSNWAVEKYRNQSISSSTNGTDSTDWRVPGFLLKTYVKILRSFWTGSSLSTPGGSIFTQQLREGSATGEFGGNSTQLGMGQYLLLPYLGE